VYEAYKDRVYSIAFHFLGHDAAAAADATQQVFLKLITEMSRFRGDAAFSTWLYRLVVNVCFDRTRRLQVERRRAGDPAAVDDLIDPRAPHDERLARRESARSIHAAIDALPPKLRLAILLRYFDDLSYEDMARALGCSIGTVSSRLSRGHRLLAERLAPLRGSGQARIVR
jgi:RNA polymerase sigma-70 factor (ECF subfamily)